MLLLSLLALVGISPAVAQMTTVGQITEFGPLTGALLNTIIKGPDGALWFTEQGDGQPGTSKIGRITTTGQISLFPTPTVQSGANNIVAGPDGNLWFTEPNTGVGNIGRITTQ
jgi:virginiamycin B lyase